MEGRLPHSPLLMDVRPPPAVTKLQSAVIQLFWEMIPLGFIIDIFPRNQAYTSGAGRMNRVMFVVWFFLQCKP